tara:strand:- start:16338 stop:16958 length:621 start_codon:yes stop_codon:yes gene_type:complete
MYRKQLKTILCFVSLLFISTSSYAAKTVLKINEKAPDFVAQDSNNDTVKLSDYKGKMVVLEWTNHKCPFVVKHYSSNNMQSLQQKYTKDGVIWLSIISSAPNKQGFVSGAVANQLTQSRGAFPTRVLLDSTGKIGRLYGAKTTPHMYIIDQEGKLRYQGAIDSIRSADPSDISKATNYVDQALTALKDKKPVSTKDSKAYGCSVKY